MAAGVATMKLKTEIKLWVAEHPIKRSRSVVRKDDGRYNIPTPSDTLSKLKYGTNMVLNGIPNEVVNRLSYG